MAYNEEREVGNSIAVMKIIVERKRERGRPNNRRSESIEKK